MYVHNAPSETVFIILCNATGQNWAGQGFTGPGLALGLVEVGWAGPALGLQVRLDMCFSLKPEDVSRLFFIDKQGQFL